MTADHPRANDPDWLAILTEDWDQEIALAAERHPHFADDTAETKKSLSSALSGGVADQASPMTFGGQPSDAAATGEGTTDVEAARAAGTGRAA